MPRKFDESQRQRFHPVNGLKRCPMCEQHFPVESFKMKTDNRRVSYCVTCYPIYYKYKGIKDNFKLSREEYDSLVKNGCSICGSHYRLAIDHNHSCCAGKKSCGQCVRGVLCMRHNLALGHAADSIDELKDLIKYLEQN